MNGAEVAFLDAPLRLLKQGFDSIQAMRKYLSRDAEGLRKT